MKTLRIIAMLLLLFNGTGAIFGGWSLMTDPSGIDLQLPVSYLVHSPFKDFFIPGLILFSVNGIFSLVVLLWTFFQWRHYYWLLMAQGAISIGWIIIQMIMLRQVNDLQFLFGGIGLVFLVIGYILKRQTGK